MSLGPKSKLKLRAFCCYSQSFNVVPIIYKRDNYKSISDVVSCSRGVFTSVCLLRMGPVRGIGGGFGQYLDLFGTHLTRILIFKIHITGALSVLSEVHIQYIPRNMHTVLLCFAFVVMQSFIMNSHEVFIYKQSTTKQKPCAYFLWYTV